MKSILLTFSIIGIIILSSCRDTATNPKEASSFSVKITVKDPNDAPVAGLRISAWNHLPPGYPQQNNNTNGGLASILSSSVINFSVAATTRVDLSIFEFDGAPVSTLINEILSPGLYSVSWYNPAHKPPRVYKYRLIALDTTTTTQLFRDSSYAVLWHFDPEIAILGWTSSSGTFETSDSLLFPNALNLPELIHTSQVGPESLYTFTIPDSVTIVLTDTLTHRQMIFESWIHKGVANKINLTWDTTLSRQSAIYQSPRADQSPNIRMSLAIIASFNWKLYQNYPNPFN